MFAAQSAKLSVDSFTRAVPLGPVAENAVNTREKWLGRQSLTGRPLITDKFRQAANDGFRQMTMLGVGAVPNAYRGALQIRGGAQLSKFWSLRVRSCALVDSSRQAISRPRHLRQTRLRPHLCGEVQDRKRGGEGLNRRCDVHPASVRSGLGRRVCPANA